MMTTNPIFVDAHAHILSYGSLNSTSIGLVVPRNKEISARTAPITDAFCPEVLERLVDFVKARPDILNDPSKWIEGMGWDHTIWVVPVSGGILLPFAFESQSNRGSN
ncbi:hypothetical protein EDD17DRAFT_994612 [Pisolithus thermaeus]|nr:hypothetical protein EDD17DRAFT_994612 [Pisolithus thermaeus]